MASSSSWRRAISENGIPYYVHPADQRTSWTHPLVAATLLQAAQKTASIQYAAYRTAAKCQILQRELRLDHLELGTVKAVVSSSDLETLEWDESIDCTGAAHVMRLLFRSAGLSDGDKGKTASVGPADEVGSSGDAATLTDASLSAALSALDRRRSGSLSAASLKLWLALMCQGRLSERFRYIHAVMADSKGRVAPTRLRMLLEVASAIAEGLGEKDTFGRHLVSNAVPGGSLNGPEWSTWLLEEPPPLVWVATLYRMTFAQTIVHSVGCSVCGIKPIVGLCYACLQCLNFNMCQECFFSGACARGHKSSHPLQEYCRQWNRRQKTRALLRTLWNKLSGGRAAKSAAFPPVAETAGVLRMTEKEPKDGGEDEMSSSEDEADDEGDLFSRTLLDGTVWADARVDSILGHLETENGRLAGELQRLRRVLPADEEVPLTPQTHITEQLCRLRSLVRKRNRGKQAVEKAANVPPRPAYLQSTPMPRISQLSPIKHLPPNNAQGPISPIVAGGQDVLGNGEESAASLDISHVISEPGKSPWHESGVERKDSGVLATSTLRKRSADNMNVDHVSGSEERQNERQESKQDDTLCASPEPLSFNRQLPELTEYSLTDVTLPSNLSSPRSVDLSATYNKSPLAPSAAVQDAEGALSALLTELDPLAEVATRPPQQWTAKGPTTDVPYQTASELMELLSDLENLCTTIKQSVRESC